MPRAWHQAAWSVARGLVFLSVLSACSATPQSDRLVARLSPDEPPVELTDTPFFPQEDLQCGPAALATLLQSTGIPISPDALVNQVYLPARQGTLQTELLAATRRYGRVAYVIDPNIESLIAELRAGHPVLVLQNLGLTWLPRWHYAVVVGFDPALRELILRSGPYRRHATRLTLFERTWQRSGSWGFVVPAPDTTPSTAAPLRYLQAVADVERLGQLQEAKQAYQAAWRRWPERSETGVALGNILYQLRDLEAAAKVLHATVATHTDAVVALNNLGQVWMELGRLHDAEEVLRRALQLDGPYKATVEQTWREFQRLNQ